MIIVTGTKRSGTSMWMQLLQAAGMPPIGSAFPRNWADTIKDANPAGFWESELRRGIYYKTNPDPKTGTYLFPEATARHAVKVFIPGLVKTDRAFIGKVIASVRPWRQYVRSVSRLSEMERQAQRERAKTEARELPDSVWMSPALEWWMENFALLSDIVTRRYPFTMVAYESVLDETETTLRRVFDWLGEGDVEAAIAEVEPRLRTQAESKSEPASPAEDEIEPEVSEVFDALYEMVRHQRSVDQAFVDRLNETNRLLGGRIQAAVQATAQAQIERRRQIAATRRTAAAAASGSSSPDDETKPV